MTGKAVFDALDTLIIKVSDVVAELERHSDVLCAPERMSGVSPGVVLEEVYQHLNQNMAELEKIEQRVMRARRLLSRLRNCSVHLAPANNLPPEILSYIFVLGVEHAKRDLDMVESSSTEGNYFEGIPFNLLVSQVCRRWRTIAINTATLWTEIYFSEKPPHNLTRLFLARSKGAILDVTLSLPDIDSLKTEARIKERIDVLCEHLSRVDSLTINAAQRTPLDHLLTTFLEKCEPQWNACGQTQTTLRKLRLSGDLHALTLNVSQDRLSFVLQMLRGVEDVVLEGTLLPWHSPAFEGLKRLHLVRLHTKAFPFERKFISIIRNCPLLESLKLEEANFRFGNWSDIADMRRETHPVNLNRLESLHLSMLPWNEMEFILHLLNAPNLKSLRVIMPTENLDLDDTYFDDYSGYEIEGLFRDEHVLKSVAAFISRSQADTFEKSLRTLHIGSFDTDDECTSPQLVEVLKVVPSLHTLSLNDVAMGVGVLSSLSAIAQTSGAPSSPSEHHSAAFSTCTMNVDNGGSTSYQVQGPNSSLRVKIVPLCPSLRVLKLSNIDAITREALGELLRNRKNRGLPLTLKLHHMAWNNLGLREELGPLCHSLDIR